MNRSRKRKLMRNAERVAEVAREKTSRTCGECQACCVRLGVAGVPKPDHVRCRHQCAAGCSIYERRPQECRAFLCGWLLGWGGDDDRPDKSGVLIAVPGKTPKLRLYRLLSVAGVDVSELPVVAKLKAAIRDRLSVRAPGLPVGFMVDTGKSSALYEIPRGTEPYFEHELRQAAARDAVKP